MEQNTQHSELLWTELLRLIILYNYRNISAVTPEDTWFATVGMQNIDGTDGIQLAYNDNFTDEFTLESFKSYKILIPPAYPPEMSPASGTFTEPTDISSNLYEVPVTISENTELKAIAVKNDYVSTSTTELYELTTTGTAITGDISGTWTITNSSLNRIN